MSESLHVCNGWQVTLTILRNHDTMSDMATSTSSQDFSQIRHYYLRVSTQGQNRLTIGTFLAGLTFAAFAALLTTSIPTPGWSSLGPLTVNETLGNGDWWSALLLALVAILLGVATFTFLLAVVGTYRALQHLAKVSPSVVAMLTNPPHPDPTGAYPPIDEMDQERLKDAFDTYTMSAYLIPRGIGALFLTLPLIALHTNWPVGVVSIVVGLILAYRLSDLRPVVVSTIRASPEDR
jgi:hypothetical protein